MRNYSMEMLAELEGDPDRLTFNIPTRGDLDQLIQIEKACYHEATIIPPETIERRILYSPENIHVLKDTETDTVLGSITMAPLRPDILEKLINLEIDETQIKVEEYLPFIPGTPLDCYVVSIIAKPSFAEKYYAGKLLLATLNFLTELLDRGVILRHIYTVATTPEGEKLAQHLQFTALRTHWSGEHEAFRHAYMLDLETVESKHKLLKMYQNHKKNLERRKKRYQKEGMAEK